MQITNRKLTDRGIRMLMEAAGISDYEKAQALLEQHGSVQAALNNL
jgi:N-acetylmuramic acid 6-phosphate etherase